MLDLTNESPLSLTEATKYLPSLGGRRLHVSTLWRWARRGCHGVRLEYSRLGHRVVTTKEALSRFAARLAEADAEADAASPLEREAVRCQTGGARTVKQRQRYIDRAKRELAEDGI